MVEALDKAAADTSSRLKATIAAFPGRKFAVLDGGQFEDLPGQCRHEGLFVRSLFLDHADEEAEKAGPWLVALDQEPKAIAKVLALVGNKPAAVFWSCDDGEAALHRHLRTLNMVRIPDWAALGMANPPDPGKPTVHDSVMFRHWDPRVLGDIVPVLDPEQTARVLGPAGEIAYVAGDYGGLKRVIREPDLPPAPRGMLTIRADQIEVIDARRRAAYYRRMSVHLRDMAPEETSGMSDDEVHDRVLRYEASGRKLGLTHERALSIWGFLMIASGERFELLPEVREFLRLGPGTPDENVETLLHQMTRLSSTLGEVR
ncbi:DUF4123 domain-containing protein [Inquilinus limosus]|uniref:DUF4123 domain-containing protein n=1 Tax=Inquilinus limosus TaxID=171674 RepID=UPI003F18E1DE